MPKETADKPNRRSVLKVLFDRWWKKVATGFIIFVVAALILIPYGIRYSVARLILKNGGHTAQIEDVDFNPFTGRVALTGLNIKVDKEQYLKITDAEVLLRWWPLLKKRVRVKKVWLNNTEMTIESLPEGRYRLGGITAVLLKGSQEEQEASEPSSWGVGASEVTIENTKVHLRMPDFQSTVHVNKWTINHAFSWQPEEMVKVAFDGKINDSPIQIEGEVTPFSKDRRLTAKLKLDRLKTEPFNSLLRDANTQIAGAVSVEADLKMTQKEDGSFTVDHDGAIKLDHLGLKTADLEATAGDLGYDGTLAASFPAKGNQVLKVEADGKLGVTGLTAETNGNQFNEEQLSWKGTLAATIDSKTKEIKAVVDGDLGSQKLKAVLANSGLTAEHSGFSWKGRAEALQTEAGTGINLDGTLAIKAARAVSEKFDALQDALTWKGRVDLDLPKEPAGLSVKTDGRLESGRLDFKMPVDKLNTRHEAIQWEGVIKYGVNENTPRIDLAGTLNIDAVGFESPVAVVAEKRIEWNGSLGAFLPQSEEKPGLLLNGRLNLGELDLALPGNQLAILQDSLTWEGPLVYGAVAQQAPASETGKLRLQNLRVTDIQKSYLLLASKEITADALRLVDSTGISGDTLSIGGLEVLKSQQAGTKNPLVAAGSISVQGFAVDPQKSIAIETITIDSWKSLLARDTKGIWSFSKGLALLSPPEKEGGAAPKKASAGQKNKLQISLGKIEIRGDSQVTFEDKSVTPAYQTQMVIDTLSLKNFDTAKAGQKCPFKLAGKIGKYTDINFDGSMQPFADRLTMDLKGKIDDLELPPLSPYIVPAIGYKFASGQSDADITMNVKSGQMDGKTQFVFKQIRAKAVDAETLAKLNIKQTIPMETALSLLRDKDGTIKLKVPITGDIADPKFSVGDAINQALLKATTKASLTYLKYALGPYGIAIAAAEVALMAANQAGRIRLEPVKFPAGSAEIDQTAQGYMEKLATILKDRPDAKIRVCGLAAESADQAGIQAQAVAAAESTDADKEPPPTDQAEEDAAPAQAAATPSAGAAVSKEQLEALAQSRSEAVKDHLVSQHGIEDDRILLCHPEIDKTQEGTPRAEILF